jgi:hypothetical protein
MSGYALRREDFAYVVEVASRHHRKQIAGSLGLTVHVRRGEVFFRGPDGAEVPLEEAHRRSQAEAQIQREIYNLFMHYAHFGGPSTERFKRTRPTEQA